MQVGGLRQLDRRPRALAELSLTQRGAGRIPVSKSN